MSKNTIEKENIFFKSLKKLVEAPCSKSDLDVTSIIFKSIDDLLLIVYATEQISLVCYDINNNQKVNEVLNAHEQKITYLKQHSDKINKINIMLSISRDNNYIKVWDIATFDCLHEFLNINKAGWINCACFLKDNNQTYILSTNCTGYSQDPEPIKVYDLKGKSIKTINDSDNNTYFIDIYYAENTSKKYIITGNSGLSRSYEYNENKLIKKYEGNDYKFHNNAIINDKGDKVNLIELSQDGNVRIWDFYEGKLLEEIHICDHSLTGLCLWNKNHLIVCCGCDRDNFKIVNLKKKDNIIKIEGKKDGIQRISKIDHSQYGECLITQGKDGFELWVLND